MEAMGYCRIKKMISWENVGWVVGSRVAGEVYGEWFHFFFSHQGGWVGDLYGKFHCFKPSADICLL